MSEAHELLLWTDFHIYSLCFFTCMHIDRAQLPHCHFLTFRMQVLKSMSCAHLNSIHHKFADYLAVSVFMFSVNKLSVSFIILTMF